MPSYHLRGSSQNSASINQVACEKTLMSEGIPMVDPSSLRLPPIVVDPLTLLDFDKFRMTPPSDGSSSTRNSLEYSEEESVSDESAYQPSYYSQWGTNLPSGSEPQSTFEPYSQSDSRKRSGSTTYSRTTPEELQYSEDPSVNLVRSTVNSSNSMHGLTDNFDQVHALKGNQVEKITHHQNNTTSHAKAVLQGDYFYSFRATASIPADYIPSCQSDTMHSVFEDDSDDEEVPYLKRVFTWNPKKSKSDKTQPIMRKQKSRVFKNFR